MPFSPILSVLVCLTSAAVFAACVLFIRSARHRAILHELLAHPARQALAVFAAATLGAALLSASAPFAVVDDHGRQLMHAGERLSSETPPLIHIIKYTLVALIAGGVTSFASILFTAAIIGARKGQNLATGITMLSSFYWRPGMLTGTALWMILTWLLLLWPDWHVLGTTAAGTDVMAMVAGLLPWGTCAAFWYLVFAYWRNIRA